MARVILSKMTHPGSKKKVFKYVDGIRTTEFIDLMAASKDAQVSSTTLPI